MTRWQPKKTQTEKVREAVEHVAAEALIRATRGSGEVLRRTATAFLSVLPDNVAGCREALSQRDFEAATLSAHRLKGDLGLLRAGRARTLAETVEDEARRGDAERASSALEELVEELAGVCAELEALMARSPCAVIAGRAVRMGSED